MSDNETGDTSTDVFHDAKANVTGEEVTQDKTESETVDKDEAFKDVVSAEAEESHETGSLEPAIESVEVEEGDNDTATIKSSKADIPVEGTRTEETDGTITSKVETETEQPAEHREVIANQIQEEHENYPNEIIDDDAERVVSPVEEVQQLSTSSAPAPAPEAAPEAAPAEVLDDPQESIVSSFDSASMVKHSEEIPPLPLRDQPVYINMEDAVEPKAAVKSFKQWFNLKLKSVNNSREVLTPATTLDQEEFLRELGDIENFDLLVSRLNRNNRDLFSKSDKDRQVLNTGATTLRMTFNEIKTGIQYTNNESLIKSIDWEFWSLVCNDYTEVVNTRHDQLIENITDGIPKELRGMVWQLMTNSKSFSLEELYRTLKLEDSPFEKAIKRDLARTSFVTTSEVKNKIDDLYEVIKTYSVFDPEVGYTQGMAFITVPLLMNMGSSEAFCMLVTLMKNYGFRELFMPSMTGLHLLLYQFDRILEDIAPDLFSYLQRSGVRSSMYATQWFLTLFGYKFPLDMVLRIFDIVIAEGLQSVLKFAVNLMLKSKDHILQLKFDDLVSFLKEKLFYYYLIKTDIVQEESNPSLMTGFQRELKSITLESYRLDDFVRDAMKVELLPLNLKRYEAEYEEIHRLETEREEEMETLRTSNGQLTREIRKLESAYAVLNREHVDVANEMIQGKVLIANLQDENKSLEAEVADLNLRVASLEKELSEQKPDRKGSATSMSSGVELSSNLEMEVKKTMERNLEVMEENRGLEEQLSLLEGEYDSLKKELEELKITHKDLKHRWGSLRKVFGE